MDDLMQPEALRLADELDWVYQDVSTCCERQAAAELRRLHSAYKDAETRSIERAGEIFQRDVRIGALETANAELLEALQPFVLANSSEEHMALIVRTADITKARAAITKHGGAV